MKRNLLIAIAIVAGLAAFVVYFRWSSAIHQPLNFSHFQHVGSQIPCATCHPPAELDSLPKTTTCAGCHGDKQFPAQVQWIRVYRVAPDIIFSHAQHLQDDCTTCHKEILARRWVHESRFTMDFCMKCHEQRRADNSCRACHKNR